eukprot:GSMAST32.ASY1.ANO1.2566.1 assembled CDS
MNTVMDDNKTLTLINGDRIAMTNWMSLIFEVRDLDVASPATVNVDELGWRPYVTSWLDSLFDKYVDPMLEFKNENCKDMVPIPDFNAVMSLCNLLEVFACSKRGVSESISVLEKVFTFCATWSIGGGVGDDGRSKFDEFTRDIEAHYPPAHTIYEYYFKLWSDKIPKSWRPPRNAKFFDIIVPTVDTVPLSQMGDNYINIIEGSMEKRAKGKKLIVFVDDLNMPAKDLFGSQAAVEILRQWMDYGGWYDRGRSQISERTQSHEQLLQEVKNMAGNLAMALIRIYKTTVTKFLPTPVKCHYLFNLRDIAKVIQGIRQTDRNCCGTKESLFTSFDDQESFQVSDFKKLKTFCESTLEDYNCEPGYLPMNLVLFDDAVFYICAISRNCMLVGQKVFNIEISKRYSSVDFHEDLKKLFMMTGVENNPTVFLFNDVQIKEESFLEDVNNILSIGQVPNLFEAEDMTEIIEGVKPAELYEFFVERVRSNLHVVLAMSPVGSSFRNRCRMFPSLEVALKFLEDAPQSFAAIHKSVVDKSEEMLLVKGYSTILGDRRHALESQLVKLQNGMDKLDESKEQVEEMSIALERKQEIVGKKQKDCEELLVRKQVEADEIRISKEAAECKAISDDAQADLGRALPALEKAMEEVKAYSSPPPLVMLALAGKKIGESNFLSQVKGYDKDNVPAKVVNKLKKYIRNPDFDPEAVFRVSKAAEALKKAMKSLAQLKEVLDKLAVLKEKYDGSVGEKNKLLAEAESLKTKLERADKLVSGLSGERVRWGESISGYQKSLVNSVGDSLIGTAFRTYAGPFDVEYRATLGSIWNEFLAKPTDVRMWNIQGLPRDSFSTENGVIVTSCERWPLMIDPQEQAKLWIRNLEGSQLKTVDLSMADFLRQLENSIQFGMPYLLQDVEEELDPALEPIIRLGEKEVDWSADFRMYITTKLANPHYTPEVSTKATIINFAVKEQGLEDQLLGIVVQKEEPKLEIQKSELVATVAAGKKKIQLKISEETEIKIDEARNSYKPISIQSSVLFFILNDLARVDPMYQFSLAAYSALFQSSIEKSRSKGGGAVEIQERIQQVNDYHMLAFFLKGGIVLDRSDQRENPCTDFIDPTGWDNIMELDALPGGHFKGLASTFEQFHRDWKEWYMTPCPEKDKCSELQRMLILRCLRGDRVVYKTSTCRIPLVFVLSPGVDPTHQVVALGKKLGDIKVKQVSLGQDGSWVFLANCHLMLSWLGTLEKIISEYCEGEPHKDFRLWLSSNPHPKFPIAILQRAAKMTTEPPRGLKANLLRFEQKYKLKKLYFSLCWFHSILLERRKFKTLGFNIPYDFNDSDWSICADILVLYLDTYPENTPWEAIQYLTAEANYGGRVTDSWDRRLLNVYIDEHRMSTLSEYYIPVDGNLESYREYIRQLPNIDKPAAFGQHSNADISSQIDDTDILLKTILSLSAGDLLEKVPETFEPEKIQEKLSSRSDPAPLKSFLMQEVQRYTKLLSFMHTSLKSLELGIQVPTAWMFAYPSLKSLGTWIRDLQQRAEQISNWSNVGVPKSFWLAGLTYPTGFLTALLQTEARANGVGIDSLSWDFPVMANTESTSIKEAPDAGAYIVGMFLEGAQWDYENTCLKDANPMELYSLMPIVHFKPVENKKRSKGLYNCPCYYFPIRTGTRERPSYMLTVDLKSGAGVPGDFWVKRGTAILLSLAT